MRKSPTTSNCPACFGWDFPADESALQSLITGIAGEALKAEDADAAARAGEVAGIAAADATLALAAAKKAAADNNAKSAKSLAELEAQPASYFGATAKSVPQKAPNAFWEWIITMPGLDTATNFVSGMGDALTFGGTRLIRQNVTIDMVNYESGCYIGGSITGGIISGVIMGGAGGCGRATSLAQSLAKAYSKLDAGIQVGGVLMKWAGGDFSFSDLLVVVSSAGILRGGCFVIDTPVAVGWSYEPIIVGQAFQPDIGVDQASQPDSRDENSEINLGWMIAGIGIVATTVYLRNKRDEEEERNKQLPRRLIFANGKFVTEPNEDEHPSFPPLGRGDYGGALCLPADPQLPNILPSPLWGEGSGVRGQPTTAPDILESAEQNHNPSIATDSDRGNNQSPEFSSMSTTTAILHSRTLGTPTDSVVERVGTRDSTGGLIPTYVGTRQPKIRNPKSKIRNLVFCLSFLLAGLCFWKGLPSAERPAQSTASASVNAPVARTLPTARIPQATKRTLVTRPIQEIRPGQRVIAKNPELAGQDVPQIEIDPEATRLVSLHMVKPDGHEVEIDTLMSLDELLSVAVENLDAETSFVSPGGSLPLPLIGSDEEVSLNELLIGQIVDVNLPELGIEGPAAITAILTCPSIEPDDGTGRRLVTSVFRHSAANVVDLETSGSNDSIGVTANHPFWSEDRQEFIPAGELAPGQNLRRADGILVQVTRISPRRGPPVPVFNFEVDGEHVYSVGVDGLLVHNTCGFGTANFGNVVHKGFKNFVLGLSRIARRAIDRTGPGITGVDLTLSQSLRLRGLNGIRKLFKHAELKPLSASGLTTFERQVRRWRANGVKGNFGLFMYDASGNIRFMGTW